MYLPVLAWVVTTWVGSPSQPHSPAAPEIPDLEQAVTVNQPDSLRVWVETPDRVRSGEPVPITLRVENIGERSLDLYIRGRTIVFDLLVSRPDGEVVWRRLEDEVIPAILRIETLTPGQIVELTESWDQRSNSGALVGPGAFTVRGEVLTDSDSLITAPAFLQIDL